MSLKALLFGSYLFIIAVISNSIIIRVRLQSGVIHRLDIDEKTTTNDFLELLQGKGYSSADASYTINKAHYSNQNITQGVFLQSFQLRQGDIIDIQSSSKLSSSSTVKGSSKASDKATTTRSSSRKDKQKAMSMSDYRKYRESLIKMKNEKSKNDRIAAVSLSSGRVLKRLTQGGIGMMLGRIISQDKKVKPLRKTAKSSTSVNEKDSSPVSLYEVHAVCELAVCTESNSLPWNIKEGSVYENMQKICQLGEQLDLEVIGCCVGIPSSSYTMWSAYHVHILLQLQEIMKKQGLLMIRYVIVFTINGI